MTDELTAPNKVISILDPTPRRMGSISGHDSSTLHPQRRASSRRPIITANRSDRSRKLDDLLVDQPRPRPVGVIDEELDLLEAEPDLSGSNDQAEAMDYGGFEAALAALSLRRLDQAPPLVVTDRRRRNARDHRDLTDRHLVRHLDGGTPLRSSITCAAFGLDEVIVRSTASRRSVTSIVRNPQHAASLAASSRTASAWSAGKRSRTPPGTRCESISWTPRSDHRRSCTAASSADKLQAIGG